MNEGKLPISELRELLLMKGAENKGIITSGMVGHDVAVIDINLAKEKVREFYNSKAEVFLVEKSDPITFPTPNPGQYAVIVNSNDIVCSGAVPYGFLVTMIAPSSTSFNQIKEIQEQIHKQCLEFDISILGGHTEISSSVNSIIISGHMIGLVPKDFFVPNTLSQGDKIIVVGFSGKEGTNILIEEAGERLSKIAPEEEIESWKKENENISILKIALEVNKRFKPRLLHDPTEGGIFGALYEIVAETELGIELEKLPPISSITEKIAKWLNFDPYRLISSGGLIIAIEEEKAEEVLGYLKQQKYPAEIVGTVKKTKNKLTYRENNISPPVGDDIIKALRNLNKK